MKYFLFIFLAYCSVISIGSARQLTQGADLVCILATRFQNATPAPKPIKISGADCIFSCDRNDISVDISLQCDVGKSPKKKQIVDVTMTLASLLTKFFYYVDCDTEIYINVNASNAKNTVEIVGVC